MSSPTTPKDKRPRSLAHRASKLGDVPERRTLSPAAVQDILEIIKKTLVNDVVHEIRLELQRGLQSLRRDTGSPFMEHNETTPLFEPSSKGNEKLENQLDLFMQLNSQLSVVLSGHPGLLLWKFERLPATIDKMKADADKFLEASEQVISQVRSLEKRLLQVEETVKDSAAKLDKDALSIQDSVTAATTHILSEMQKAEQFQTSLHETTVSKIDQIAVMHQHSCLESSNFTDNLIQQMNYASQQLDVQFKQLSSRQEHLEQLSLTNASDLGRMIRLQEHSEEGFSDVRLTLTNHLSAQNTWVQSLQATVEGLKSSHGGEDMIVMLGEIARVQKALNIEYLQWHPPATPEIDSPKEDASLKEAMPTPLMGAMSQAPALKRMREFFTQTESNRKESAAQTDPIKIEDLKKTKNRSRQLEKQQDAEKKAATTFAGAERLKKQAKEASIKRTYNVFDYYHETGCCQHIAKSSWFENMTLAMVSFNAIWIAIDADYNKANVLLDADLLFQIMDNVFCGYFFFEMVIRFGAFQKKCRAFRDMWFLFDLCLSFMMVAETWVLSAVLVILDTRTTGANTGATSILKVFRMVRLARLTRVARIFRAIPEIVIILKGIAYAARSVGVFMLLWILIIYVFAIFLRQLTDGQHIGDVYFESVPASMNTLLLNGLFADVATLVNTMSGELPYLWPIMFLFFVLVSLTIMYMLLGVLVDVVATVATSEKEAMAVSILATELRTQLSLLGYADDMKFNQEELQSIMMQPSIVKIMQDEGVDVNVLADMLELICQDVSNKEGGVVTFADIVDIVLNMRGTNPATVKDCKEQIRVTKALLKHHMDEFSNDFQKCIHQLIIAIQKNDEDDGNFQTQEIEIGRTDVAPRFSRISLRSEIPEIPE